MFHWIAQDFYKAVLARPVEQPDRPINSLLGPSDLTSVRIKQTRQIINGVNKDVDVFCLVARKQSDGSYDVHLIHGLSRQNRTMLQKGAAYVQMEWGKDIFQSNVSHDRAVDFINDFDFHAIKFARKYKQPSARDNVIFQGWNVQIETYRPIIEQMKRAVNNEPATGESNGSVSVETVIDRRTSDFFTVKPVVHESTVRQGNVYDFTPRSS